jgi:hypothetical protein
MIPSSWNCLFELQPLAARMLVRGSLGGAMAALLLLSSTGCGQKLVKSNGIVTLDDQPLEGATLTFTPVRAGKGRVATARSGTGGSFQLTTHNTGDGAEPGEYKVTVIKTKQREDTPTAPPTNPSELESAKKFMMKAMGMPNRASSPGSAFSPRSTRPAETEVPKIYSDADKTPLKVTIPCAEGQIKLGLTSK